jgi:hypothetical protein
MIEPQEKPILAAALAFVIYKVNPVIESQAFIAVEGPEEHHGHGSHTLGGIQSLAKHALEQFINCYLEYNAAGYLIGWGVECEYVDRDRVLRIQLVNGSDVFEL